MLFQVGFLYTGMLSLLQQYGPETVEVVSGQEEACSRLSLAPPGEFDARSVVAELRSCPSSRRHVASSE